ncbi:hypothetical protein XU18_1091 [Perkinsela sp. CCAP 1560/4]|nr:hypothetical protein XU18_1091 [Perkinsela sp. CCAP 1560/4]|eukprot:KNH08378.1 hypothetical protein XU18_1091 [Perkinsela sp. CCAP 1560/4]
MNPLESLFNRLEITEHYPHFVSKGVNSIAQLRLLGSSEIMNIAKNKKVTDKLANALSKGTVNVPGSLKTSESTKTKQGTYADHIAQGFKNGASTPKQYAGGEDNWETKGKGEKNNAKNRRKKQHTVEPVRKDPSIVDEAMMETLIDSSGTPSLQEEENLPAALKKARNPKPDRCKNREFSLEMHLSQGQMRVLFGQNCAKLKKIHDANQTSNGRIEKDTNGPSIPFTIYGSSLEDCIATKEAIKKHVGIGKYKDEEARLHYKINEIEINIRAMLYIMHKNLHKEPSEQMRDSTLRGIASYLNFDKHQGTEHFTYLCKNDKMKKWIIDMLIKQFADRIQMIIYCTSNQAPILKEHLMKRNTSKEAQPVLLIPATKEDIQQESAEVWKQRRHDALKGFKNGAVSSVPYESNGIKETVVQRLLVATDDYARYARAREIPHVNLIIHYSPPRQREWSLFRSATLARGARSMGFEETVGYELSLYTEQEGAMQEELKKLATFKKLPHEEECEYFQRWDQTLKPETNENPYVNYKNVEPIE